MCDLSHGSPILFLMSIVAIANQKGGVGKTTTALNLSAGLAELGKRILIIDFDPQANATSSLGFYTEPGDSLYGPLVEDGSGALSLILQTEVENLHCIPSHLELAGAEIDLARKGNHWTQLSLVLNEQIRDMYDYIIIDCPPSLGILMTAALATAKDLLVPVQCEYFSMQGLEKIDEVLTHIQESGANPDARLEGIIMTMYTHTRLARGVLEEVRASAGSLLYDTVIPRSVKIAEAPSHNLTVLDYDPRGAGALGYRALAREFLKRRKKSYAIS